MRISLWIACVMTLGFASGQFVGSSSFDGAQRADTFGHALIDDTFANSLLRTSASGDQESSSRTETEVRILIPPDFEKTGAFVILCVVALVTLIGFLFWLRVRQVSTMLQQRLEARLAERDRIARDLHDTLLQSTEGLILKVYTAARQLPPGDPTREMLTRSVDQAEQLAVEGRVKLLGLTAHTRSRQELSQALAALGLELSAESTTSFTAVKKGRVRALEATTWDEVFSIAREAMINAFRHAAAGHIEAIVIYGASTLTVQIRDDGCGMPQDMTVLSARTGHMGLRVIRERASQLDAELKVDTISNEGTTVCLTVPSTVSYLRRSTADLVNCS
jgi:signal transduction histidine kinase